LQPRATARGVVSRKSKKTEKKQQKRDMIIRKFEDIIAWQKAQDFAVTIYTMFKNQKDFGFKDQIQRAAISISNNIAEGFDRSSDADFSKFLYISLASCSEVKSMIYLACKLKYLTLEEQNLFVNDSDEISKILRGLIKSLQPKLNTH
jgi:four helix bundle protein